MPSDQQIFAELYPGLRRFAAVVGSTEDDPDDLVQDAIVRVLRRDGLAGIDHPSAYLRRAILNLASDRRRSLGRRRAALTRLGRSESSTPRYPSDLGDLDRLDPTDRAVLYLGEVEGLSWVEVAEALDLSHDVTRARASRARRTLRAAIENEETSR